MDVCLLYAPLVALVVACCKRLPFIGRNPKVVAAVLSGVLVYAQARGLSAPSWHAVAELVPCILVQLAGAVATHEVALKPVTRAARTVRALL